MTNKADMRSIFARKPPHWGLRGDPYLWAELKELLSGVALPATEAEFVALVKSGFEKLTGHPITSSEYHIYIERYSHGGMSSGGVAPWFWRETAIPLLLARYRRSASATFGRREESVGFFPEEFVALRPFLYHVLARENLAVLKATKTLWSTAALARRSGRTDILDACRRNSTGVRIPEGVVLVRDQKPLTMGNVEFESGWDAEDLLCDLNGRVFLWPGGHDGPIAYGRRHAESYESTDTLIRIPTWDIFDQAPVFSKYNSGSPRCNEGRKSPRGPDTFLPAERCNYRPGKVVEVAFVDVLFLPESTEWRPGPGTDWRALFRT